MPVQTAKRLNHRVACELVTLLLVLVLVLEIASYRTDRDSPAIDV